MSTFDARPGTRGARPPGSRIALWINGFVAKRVASAGIRRRPTGKSRLSA